MHFVNRQMVIECYRSCFFLFLTTPFFMYCKSLSFRCRWTSDIRKRDLQCLCISISILPYFVLHVWKWVCSFWKLKYIVFYCAICETFFVFLVSNWGCTETNGERKRVTEEVWRTAIQERCSDLWQLMIRTTTWRHLTDATLLWWHVFVSCDIAVVTWPMTCDSFWLQTQNRYYIS